MAQTIHTPCQACLSYFPHKCLKCTTQLEERNRKNDMGNYYRDNYYKSYYQSPPFDALEQAYDKLTSSNTVEKDENFSTEHCGDPTCYACSQVTANNTQAKPYRRGPNRDAPGFKNPYRKGPYRDTPELKKQYEMQSRAAAMPYGYASAYLGNSGITTTNTISVHPPTEKTSSEIEVEKLRSTIDDVTAAITELQEFAEQEAAQARYAESMSSSHYMSPMPRVEHFRKMAVMLEAMAEHCLAVKEENGIK